MISVGSEEFAKEVVEMENLTPILTPSKRIVLFGGGNQLHYTIDIIHKQNIHQIIGIIDSVHDIGTELCGYKVIGRQQDIKTLVDKYQIEAGLITIGDNWTRHIVHKCITEILPEFEFVNAIHPSVIIGENVKLGIGIVAMAGVIFNPKAEIGNFTFFATGAQIEHDCVILDFASVSAGSIMGGFVEIGKFSAITLGVTIIDRLKIGEHTVVGSGSLVLKDLPGSVLAYGHPINKIIPRRKEDKFLK